MDRLIPEEENQNDGNFDHAGNHRTQSRTGDTHFRCTAVTEDKNIVGPNIDTEGTGRGNQRHVGQTCTAHTVGADKGYGHEQKGRNGPAQIGDTCGNDLRLRSLKVQADDLAGKENAEECEDTGENDAKTQGKGDAFL